MRRGSARSRPPSTGGARTTDGPSRRPRKRIPSLEPGREDDVVGPERGRPVPAGRPREILGKARQSAGQPSRSASWLAQFTKSSTSSRNADIRPASLLKTWCQWLLFRWYAGPAFRYSERRSISTISSGSRANRSGPTRHHVLIQRGGDRQADCRAGEGRRCPRSYRESITGEMLPAGDRGTAPAVPVIKIKIIVPNEPWLYRPAILTRAAAWDIRHSSRCGLGVFQTRAPYQRARGRQGRVRVLAASSPSTPDLMGVRPSRLRVSVPGLAEAPA